MLCEDPAAQCFATVTLLADGVECPEYQISSDTQGNVQGFISLRPDQTIKVRVAYDLNTDQFEVDFFADGVIRNFWVSKKNTLIKHRNSTMEFSEGMYETAKCAYRSPIKTMAVPQHCLLSPVEADSSRHFIRPHVGSIGINISMLDTERNSYYHQALRPHDVPDDWDHQALAPIGVGAHPSLQMTFKDGGMSKSQRSTTRNQLSRSRKGKAPWRTFTFYYREPNQDGIPSIWNHASTLATQRPTVSDYAAESETSSQHVAYTRPLSAVGYNGISLQPPTMTANEGAPEVPAGPKSARLESLRLELEDLQAQVQLRRHHRLKVEAMTKAVSPEARLECEKAILQRELANEQALAATFETIHAQHLAASSSPSAPNTTDDWWTWAVSEDALL